MNHLAIIPDGNRRWAKKNKLKTFMGHTQGIKAIEKTITICKKNAIQYLSMYVFSLENFNRNNIEKSYLLKLFNEYCSRHLPDLIKEGIKVKVIGDKTHFPSTSIETINMLEEETKHGKTLQLNLLFCYGGQQEIVFATRTIAEQVKNNMLAINDITTQTVKNALWTNSIPEPDLFIRTSGVIRLSNFLLFQQAYTEFMFIDELWPEITEEILQNCIDKFNKTTRNFGV